MDDWLYYILIGLATLVVFLIFMFSTGALLNPSCPNCTAEIIK